MYVLPHAKTLEERRGNRSGRSRRGLARCVQVRQKLVNTRKRMEDILQGGLQNDDDEWYETTDALAQPLLSCYWSLWECGSGIVAEGAKKLMSANIRHLLSRCIALYLMQGMYFNVCFATYTRPMGCLAHVRGNKV